MSHSFLPKILFNSSEFETKMIDYLLTNSKKNNENTITMNRFGSLLYNNVKKYPKNNLELEDLYNIIKISLSMHSIFYHIGPELEKTAPFLSNHDKNFVLELFDTGLEPLAFTRVDYSLGKSQIGEIDILFDHSKTNNDTVLSANKLLQFLENYHITNTGKFEIIDLFMTVANIDKFDQIFLDSMTDINNFLNQKLSCYKSYIINEFKIFVDMIFKFTEKFFKETISTFIVVPLKKS